MLVDRYHIHTKHNLAATVASRYLAINSDLYICTIEHTSCAFARTTKNCHFDEQVQIILFAHNDICVKSLTVQVCYRKIMTCVFLSFLLFCILLFPLSQELAKCPFPLKYILNNINFLDGFGFGLGLSSKYKCSDNVILSTHTARHID